MTVTSVTAVAVSFRASSVSGSSGSDAPARSTGAAVAARRAETLVSRLDTDEDGAVSKDEFTSGAIDLLKRASVRAHHRHVGRGEGIEKRDARWLGRLERAFDRIDANGDGSLDAGEVAAQLTGRPGRRNGQVAGDESASGAPSSPATSVTSVTIVAIAIRRYTVDAAQTAPPATPETPVANPETPADAPLAAPVAADEQQAA